MGQKNEVSCSHAVEHGSIDGEDMRRVKWESKRRQFERWIAEAVSALPQRLRRRLDNVAFVLEAEASGGRYLGLYHGIPHLYRGQGYSGVLPDKITIYARPIEAAAPDPRELPRLVRRVVWHEIGHHFGFTDAELAVLERRWEKRRTKLSRVDSRAGT